MFVGGIVKYAILRFLAFWNNHKTNTYFYSILYTGKIFENRLKNMSAPREFDFVEFGVHPNILNLYKNADNIFDENIVSKNR